ncbi:MAG TPA: hypothetical protein VEB66_16240, partial [Opitutaceae bacterium]|nr:hypothetical protein [Opitutaceae bacterium]
MSLFKVARLLMGLVILALACRAATEPERYPSSLGRPIAERRPLLVGASPTGFPYGYRTEDGRWTGFASELLDAVAKTAN